MTVGICLRFFVFWDARGVDIWCVVFGGLGAWIRRLGDVCDEEGLLFFFGLCCLIHVYLSLLCLSFVWECCVSRKMM